MGELLARNIRHHRGLLLTITLGLFAFEALIIRVIAAFATGPGLRTILDMIPPAFRAALDSQIGLLTFATAPAFGFQHPFALAGTIGFVVVAATIPAAERERGLLDLLLARPITRREYLLASLILVVMGAVLLPLAQLAGAAVALAFVDAPGAIPGTRYIPSAMGLITLLLAIGGCALLSGSGAKRRGPAASPVVGLTMAAYVVELLADLWAPLRWIRWASPFHYFKPIPAAVVPSTPFWNPVILLGIFAAATALAFVRFQRRDL
jgi:beta-exotoxin I transport system permease protein